MKTKFKAVALAIALGALPGASRTVARPQSAASNTATSPATSQAGRADAYYYFTVGHLQEMQYELTGGDSLAEQSIDSYKKALELDPTSSVIMERLAEIEAKSRRLRAAVQELQDALKADPNDADAHRLLARIYVRALSDLNAGDAQREDLAKAVEQFEDVLKLEPDDTYSALWLSRLYGFQNQQPKAEEVLRGVLRRDPANEAALEQLSRLMIDEGRFQEAINLLSAAAADSSSPDLHDQLGEAYAQTHDYAHAEQEYQTAVTEDPDSPGHRHGLARALLAQDKYAEALAQYKRLSELEPGTAENYMRMAQLNRRLGKFDEAASNLARAKKLSPGSIEVLYNEALLDEDEGRYDDAVKVLSDAIAGIKSQGEANPAALAILDEQLGQAYRRAHNYPAAIDTFKEMGTLGPEAKDRARLLLIDTYRRNHDLNDAIAEAKKGLAESPKDRGLTITLALLYGEASNTDAATGLLRGLLQGNEGDQEIYLDLAQVQERGRKYSDAEKSAEMAAQLAHDSSGRESAWFMLGAIFERQKKFAQAEEQFRKALDVDPNDAPVLNYYGYMLADRGVRVSEATSLIERAVKQDPGNGAYLDSLGWAYFKQNKLAEAEEYLRKAIDREGNDPTILGHLGAVYLRLGQNQQAADTLERALAEWQKALPADYEAEKVSEVEAQLKNLKRRLAQKSSPDAAKPQ